MRLALEPPLVSHRKSRRFGQKKGIFFALTAFIMWGIAPVYFKQIAHIDSFEILAQRIIWSVLFLVFIIKY